MRLKIFSDFIRMLSICVKVIVCGYSVAGSLVCLAPLLLYCLDNSVLQPIAPLCLPGTIYYESIDDYAINCIYCIFSVMYSTVAYVYFDGLFFFQILHIRLMAMILQQKIRSTNLYSVDAGPLLPSTRFEMKINIRNMVMLHTELLGYVSTRQASELLHSTFRSFGNHKSFLIRYVQTLREIYYLPIATIVLLAAGSIGRKFFATLTVNEISLFSIIFHILANSFSLLS